MKHWEATIAAFIATLIVILAAVFLAKEKMTYIQVMTIYLLFQISFKIKTK